MSYEPFNTPYEKEAYLLLYGAESVTKTLFVQAGDLTILAADIKSVADLAWEEELEEEEIAQDAAQELLRRIGGMTALPSYMKCLRVHA